MWPHFTTIVASVHSYYSPIILNVFCMSRSLGVCSVLCGLGFVVPFDSEFSSLCVNQTISLGFHAFLLLQLFHVSFSWFRCNCPPLPQYFRSLFLFVFWWILCSICACSISFSPHDRSVTLFFFSKTLYLPFLSLVLLAYGLTRHQKSQTEDNNLAHQIQRKGYKVAF